MHELVYCKSITFGTFTHFKQIKFNTTSLKFYIKVPSTCTYTYVLYDVVHDTYVYVGDCEFKM